jgi:hypothetical protein
MIMSRSGMLAWLLAGLIAVSPAVFARPISAEVLVPQPVSYSPLETLPSPSGARAATKNIRMACYPVWAECTKDSDCCTGYCRVGRVTAYCDHK